MSPYIRWPHQTLAGSGLQDDQIPDDAQRDDVTAVVLCGGAGRRMGGADKPLLEWRGAPMVARVVASASKQAGQVVINANRNIDRYARYAQVLTDAPRASHGPLTGVLRAMESCESPWIWVCPGDAPLLASDLLARLRAATPPALVSTAHDGERHQWLHMLVHRSMEPALRAYLDSDGYSVHRWIHSLPTGAHQAVCCKDIHETFLNVNTPEALAD